MNDQPVPNNLMPAPAQRSNMFTIVLILILSLGAIVFGVLAIVGFSKAHTATASLNAAKLAAAAAARTDQQTADAASAAQSSESPFRAYNAPAAYGSFQINFPKNWSSTVDEEQSSTSQVVLILNPDFVRKTDGKAGLLAAEVTLSQRGLDNTVKTYAGQKGVFQSDVTVSGIKSVQLAGTFNDKRTARLVLVPVRDKVLIFTNEDKTYAHEFDQILAQAKIIP